ncbi:DUF1996 domain-containing protein [Streptomyces sp. LaPpAH-108]|uniref:DUF1996 domain-containing protein n=1 Tax=Streptomyces sp. LaPpAH-108 TaxID=1155714 RepID=UPI000475FB8C|nr:DUF1996 domain-containing protein [Streptomyces sp. LaPpAH-108]
MLGGGGLVAANVYASASEGGWGGQSPEATGQVKAAGMATIDCPDVGTQLTKVPEAARADVDRELAQLDQQIAAAYQQLQQSAPEIRQDPAAADGPIMNPLKDKRKATLDRVADAIGRAGDRPEGLDALAACTMRPAESAPGDSASAESTPPAATQPPADNGQAPGQGGNGPVAADYTDIKSVQPNVPNPAKGSDASGGSFTSECGVNENGLRNSDNVIVAPGVSNGAHHFHDYVGNQSNTAFASDDDLAKADTSCVDKGDKSTYYWPVLRLQNGKQEKDAGAPGGGTEGNAGEIVTPKQVTITFEGNPRGKVAEMPRLLRIITGDAKSFVNGPANANASWSCTGFEDRQLKDKYPLCPSGSDVVRTFRFQSCWDGRNTDSANHRTHVAFAGEDGACPEGFEPIPQLVQRIVYDVDAPSLNDGGKTVPLFAVDSFPEQQHKPVTDHGDFINVFDENLMREMVDCINSGRTCGPRGDDGGDKGGDQGGDGKGDGQNDNGGKPGDDATASSPAEAPQTDATVTPTGGTKHDGHGKGGKQDEPGKAAEPTETTEPAQAPKSDRTTAPADRTTAPGSKGTETAEATPSVSATDSTGVAAVPQTTPPPATGTEPQTSGGSLAETGAQLWPAAIGVLLALSGLVMFLRARRLRY